MLTDAQLQKITPNLGSSQRALYLPPLNAAMQRYGVDTALRIAAFIAQLAHETGEFRWMEEIWGPTPAQRRYEPPGDLAQRLGNTQPGDGQRFKGRGPIQITGRFNYAKYGELLGIDLTAAPARAAAPEIAFATAGLYWQSNGLNELADRQMFYERAKAVLGVGAATRGLPATAPLARGHEAIRADARRQAPPPKKAVARKAPAVRKVAAKKATAKRKA